MEGGVGSIYRMLRSISSQADGATCLYCLACGSRAWLSLARLRGGSADSLKMLDDVQRGGGLAVRAPAAPLPVLAFAFKPVLVPRPSAYRSAKCWSGAMPNLICTSNGITCRHLGVGMILPHHSRRALGRFEVLSFALEVFDPQEAAGV